MSHALLGFGFPRNCADRRILGFTAVAVAAAGIAKILFVIFLILFLISIVTHLARGTMR